MARIDAKTGAPIQRGGEVATIMADLAANRPRLATALDRVPDQAGVYLFKDGKGRLLYVGKAESLRSRVAN